MKPYLIDVPVYLNFFNRPDTFKQVFEAVRQARPSKLFLSCDGCRKGNLDDIDMVKACQKIVENIDWECEVHKNYSEENLGCGMRMYSGITWAFQYVDRLIVLEDDCVPSQDFFPFCAELLERYKDDIRIFRISAMNHLGVYNATPNSYFFSTGSCWAWATWKRTWDKMDFRMGFMCDEYSMKCVERKYPFHRTAITDCKKKIAALERGENLSTWAAQYGISVALESQMEIVPCVNLVTNIGYSGVHSSSSDIRMLDRRSRAYYNQPIYKLNFPLKHPKYVVADWNYYDLVMKKFNATFTSRLESIARRLIFSNNADRRALFKKIFLRIREKL